MPSFRYGLRSQLAFNLGLVMLLASMGLSFLALYVAQVRDMQLRRRHLQEMAEFLEVGWQTHPISAASASQRLQWLHRWLRMIRPHQPEAAFCLDVRGHLVWQMGRIRAQEKTLYIQTTHQATTPRFEIQRDPQQRGEVWERSVPLYEANKKIGAVWIRWRIALDRQAFFAYQTLLLIYLFLFCAIILFILLFFLTRRLVRPLERLGHAMDHLAAKGRSDGLEIEVTRQDEIGDLARSFVGMESILQVHQTTRETQLQALQEANKILQRAQNELIQREKLSSVGQMAAGVAHEIGNPLSAIMGYSDLLATSETWSEAERDLVKRIEKEAKRIDRIIRDLLDYARPKQTQTASCWPNQAIEEAIELLSLQPRFRQATLQQEVAPDLPIVPIESSALMQVLINLLLNAADATQGKGPIWLSAALQPTEGSALLVLCVEDAGPGVPATLREKIFEPFFTTKEPGKGVGLGLAICQRTLLEAGGTLEVTDNTRNTTGACFRITLPLQTSSKCSNLSE
ncbi:ATP-binding protein [Myxococcota bacterium]|nr:ATP-binding protein [Myxococcota bacterium]